MRYLDTSLLVAALTDETGTARARACLVAGELMMISEWSLTEVSSALSTKVRTRQIVADRHAAAIAVFNRLVADSFDVAPVSIVDFRTATRFVDQHETGLRAGDALHLAVAAAFGATVWTLDRQMATAGPIVGVPTQFA